MKLMTLNIWGGHVRKPLLEFIQSQRDVDIFCFQEVYHNAPHKISSEDRQVSLNVFAELQSLLSEHVGYFRPVVENIYGLGTFIKKNIQVLREGEITIHHNPNYVGRGPTHSRNLQWLEFESNQQRYSILNVHGLWNGMGKTDCPERIKQSERIVRFMETLKSPMILCGDLNLKPDTLSLQMLEKNMTNLVKTYRIASTRTSFYSKPERFADYILISPEIVPAKFEVLKEEVSDHAPLLLDFMA